MRLLVTRPEPDASREAETLIARGHEPVLAPLLAIEFVPGRPGDYAGRQVSAEKASRVLGWEARTSFEEGMRRYTDWWMEESEEGAPQAGEV